MNIEHHYVESGSGVPLILLHGNGENNEYFVNQIEYFSKAYRVIALDTRGHGKTKRGEAEFSIAQFADDLKLFLDRLSIDRAIILGFSDGGNIALLFALKYPEYVEKLILNAANLYPTGQKNTMFMAVWIGYEIYRILALLNFKYEAKKELFSLMTHHPHVDPKELSRLLMPVLVIAGTNDVIKKKHTQLIYNSLPKGKLVILEGDHFIANKKWKQFNEAIEQFLGYA